MTSSVRELAMFPLSTVLFPSATLGLRIFEPRYRLLLQDCLGGAGELGVVLITRGSEVGGGDQRATVATLAAIDAAVLTSEGSWAITVSGRRRIKVVEWLDDDPYPRAMVQDATPPSDPVRLTRLEVEGAARVIGRTRALLSELHHTSGLEVDEELTEDLGAAVWRLCDMAPLTAFDKQALLEIDDPSVRLRSIGELARAVGEDVAALLAQGID